MRAKILLTALALLPQLSAHAGGTGTSFQVLAYHDVRDQVDGNFDADQQAISTANLIDHFTWLKLNGFTVVSVDDLIAAGRGEKPLPERAVLLSFDDGFASVATHVLPLLELFDYPAVISVVTDWIESDPDVIQGNRRLSRDDFLSWEQIRALSEHPLVEIASHSHASHRGIVGNPQGNLQPALATAAWTDGAYESETEFAGRLRNDLAASVERIEQATGRRPRVLTWPYGAFNGVGLEVAADLGMDITLSLSDGTGNARNLGIVPRHLIAANPSVDELGWSLLHPAPTAIVRAAQVDLDYVYDPDPAQQEENLSRLLDRIQAMKITHVYLQAFADPDADGGAQALYFPNRFLPMRADLFNRVTWQLQTRANVRVYGWLPLLSFEGEGIDPAWRVRQWAGGTAGFDADSEPRLSPFSSEARAVIEGIYADLARHTAIDGILFHDDGRFNELEDWSEAAVAAYSAEFGPEISLAALAADSALRERWARFRSDALIGFSLDLAGIVRHYRPEIRTSRNLFASALLDAEPELHLAQSYDAFLAAYDYVAVMAMPGLEGHARHPRFYQRLAARAAEAPAFRERVIFELQTVEWPSGRAIDSAEIGDTLRQLQVLGVRNLAYYPDDFIAGHPSVEAIREGMSIALYPQGAPR